MTLGGTAHEKKNEKARYPGEKPMCILTVRYLIFGHRLFPSGQCLLSLLFFRKNNKNERARRGWGRRKPGEVPKNQRRPAKSGEGPETNLSLFVWRCVTCKSASMAAGDACAAADAGDAFDAGDASELVMPKSI